MNQLRSHLSHMLGTSHPAHFSIVLLALALCGCEKEPMGGPRVETVPITGKVLVDGKPVKGIAVLFLRVSDLGVDFPVPEPEGSTDENGIIKVGSYYAADGGAPGEYKLCFVWGIDSDKFRGRYDNKEKSKFTVVIPEQAGDKPFDIGTIELSTKPPTIPKPDSSKPAQEPADQPEQSSNDVVLLNPEKVVSLNPEQTVQLDADRKRVFLQATVVLREGLLEMFACRAGSKEHESVVSVETEAYVIHAALLAAGAEAGEPVQFEPEYQPPQGQLIDIFVNWTDEEGHTHRQPAQHWMRHSTHRYFLEPLESLPKSLTIPEEGELRYDEKRGQLIWFGPMSEQNREELLALSKDEAYQKCIHSMFDDSQPREMEADFVFAGSGFWEEEDGTKFYLAESGNLICVANFSDAIIDIDVKSDSANDALMFEPFTERIPPLGTEVTVELVPRPQKEATPDAS